MLFESIERDLAVLLEAECLCEIAETLAAEVKAVLAVDCTERSAGNALCRGLTTRAFLLCVVLDVLRFDDRLCVKLRECFLPVACCHLIPPPHQRVW